MFKPVRNGFISIHAPRVGSDIPSSIYDLPQYTHFYPRSPRGERRIQVAATAPSDRFLSTLPAWGATRSMQRLFPLRMYFYPRSPRGERLSFFPYGLFAFFISIHAPRVGSDPLHFYTVFLFDISIHAPRVGSDPFFQNSIQGIRLFLSTLPAWGATKTAAAWIPRMTQFLSTLPAWGATITERCRAYLNKFLSTLPAWGATHAITPLTWVIRYFYPRSPRGERHSNGFNSSGWFGISIHAPRVGSDDTSSTQCRL